MAGPKPLEASRERSRPSDELLFRCQAAEAENQRLMEMLKATEAQLEATKGELHHATAAAEHSVQGSLGTLEEIEELRATAAEWQAKAVEGERWEARAREAEAEVKRLHAAHGTLSGELSAAQLQRDEIEAMDASHRMQVAQLMEEKHKVLSNLLEEREKWAEERAQFQVELSRARREATSPPAAAPEVVPNPPSKEELQAFANHQAHTVYDRSAEFRQEQPKQLAARPHQGTTAMPLQTEPNAFVDEAKIRSRNEQIFSKLEELEGRLQARIRRKR